MRPKRFIPFLLALFVLLLLSGCASKSEAAGKPKLLQAVVTHVSDGDTVHVRLNGRDERVRLIGVNTPEISHPDLGIREQPYGKQAAAYTRKRLLKRKVWLEFDVQQRDKYGRLLAYVWLSPPAAFTEKEVRARIYNAELLLNGYAQVMTVPPNVKYADIFVKFQREAREKGKGLWGAPAVAKPAGKALYVGNRRTKIFHRAGCRWAQKISPANRVEFGSREEAIKAGYRPCRVCRS
ncbi:micrococcal nuclease [Thermodesulfitimonas autotrophica]|uniref:Micrococcal nuclease n=1 Tax=Thermodesulfitimonas autotrophica TaxID=1894989 RepID=A0A3N5BUB7_9THEO|nr:micrococcal nuclease [Thermodesulfitimonas autotrophica]